MVFGDNQSALHLCKNLVFHESTKHVIVIYHFIRVKVVDGLMKIEKIAKEDNLAYMGTKTLSFSKFKHCLELLKIGDGRARYF